MSVMTGRTLMGEGKFDGVFDTEAESFGEISRLIPRGEECVNTLYSYRSLSKSIPPNVNSRAVPKGASEELIKEINEKNEDINERIIDMLRPEMIKLRDVMIFVGSFVSTIRSALIHLVSSEMKGKLLPDEVFQLIIKGIDLLLKIDYLKDSKSCFKNDFLRYKSAISMQSRKRSVTDNAELLEELTQMQVFLSHPDPRKARHFIHLTLREEIRTLTGHERLMLEFIDYCLKCLDNHIYMLPEEFFQLLRVLPHLMLFADGNADYHSMNIFNDSRMPRIRKIFVENPVIPVYRDLTVTLLSILEMSANFDRLNMASTWGDVISDAVIAKHNVSSQWMSIKAKFEDYSPRLLALLHNVESFPFVKQLDSISIDRARIVYEIIQEGLRIICDWNCLIQRSLAWKYTHPAPLEHLREVQANMAHPAFEYESRIKYNFTKMELSMFADIVATIKSIASMLEKAKADFAPIIRFYIHRQVQQLIQGDLLPVLHRMNKRKKEGLESLLALRLLHADWTDGEEPLDDYKSYSRKKGSVFASHPARVVGPQSTQLQNLRWSIFRLCHPASPSRRGSGIIIPGKPDLEEDDVRLLDEFYKKSFFYPYMIDYHRSLHLVSDLSYLWFRETFLEITRCTQFAVETSLPYMLTERALHSRTETTSHLSHDNILPLIEDVFYVMDIYNDAAYEALYVYRQQFLFDEIEAEANLIFDTFVQVLSADVFSHYKNLAAYTKMDKDFKDKLVLNGELHFNTNKRRFEVPILQRSVRLVGRTVNLAFLVKQHVNNLFLHDIEQAFVRFEHNGICGITEFSLVVDVIQETHALLSDLLELDPFVQIFREYNETFDSSAKRGAVNNFIVKFLLEDLFPNYVYNIYSERFVKGPLIVKRRESTQELPAFSTTYFGFGTLCGKAYHTYCKLTSSVFDKSQLVSLYRIPGTYLDLAFLFDQCILYCWNKLHELQEYVSDIEEHVPTVEIATTDECQKSFSKISMALKELLLFQDFKLTIFQCFREIGNTFSFIHMLSDVNEVFDQYRFSACAPFLGFSPVSQVTSLDRRKDNEGNLLDFDALSKISPLGKTFFDVIAQSAVSQNYAKDPLIVNMTPQLTFRTVHSMGSAIQPVYFLHVFIRNIGSCLQELGLCETWGSVFMNSGDVEIEHSSKEFYRFWSILTFIFNFNELSEYTPADIIDPESELPVRNQDEFGHGFTICGCLFLHLLNQRVKHELLDFNRILFRANSIESTKREALRKSLSSQTEEEGPTHKAHYLSLWSMDKEVHYEIFSLLEAACPHQKPPFAVFSPPQNDRP